MTDKEAMLYWLGFLIGLEMGAFAILMDILI